MTDDKKKGPVLPEDDGPYWWDGELFTREDADEVRERAKVARENAWRLQAELAASRDKLCQTLEASGGAKYLRDRGQLAVAIPQWLVLPVSENLFDRSRMHYAKQENVWLCGGKRGKLYVSRCSSCGLWRVIGKLGAVKIAEVAHVGTHIKRNSGKAIFSRKVA